MTEGSLGVAKQVVCLARKHFFLQRKLPILYGWRKFNASGAVKVKRLVLAFILRTTQHYVGTFIKMYIELQMPPLQNSVHKDRAYKMDIIS